MTYDVTHESKLDAAISRGFDPHESQDVPGPPLSAEWQAMLDASVAQAKALRGESDERLEREIDRLLAQDLADRDREWWGE